MKKLTIIFFILISLFLTGCSCNNNESADDENSKADEEMKEMQNRRLDEKRTLLLNTVKEYVYNLANSTYYELEHYYGTIDSWKLADTRFKFNNNFVVTTANEYNDGSYQLRDEINYDNSFINVDEKYYRIDNLNEIDDNQSTTILNSYDYKSLIDKCYAGKIWVSDEMAEDFYLSKFNDYVVKKESYCPVYFELTTGEKGAIIYGGYEIWISPNIESYFDDLGRRTNENTNGMEIYSFKSYNSKEEFLNDNKFDYLYNIQTTNELNNCKNYFNNILQYGNFIVDSGRETYGAMSYYLDYNNDIFGSILCYQSNYIVKENNNYYLIVCSEDFDSNIKVPIHEKFVKTVNNSDVEYGYDCYNVVKDILKNTVFKGISIVNDDNSYVAKFTYEYVGNGLEASFSEFSWLQKGYIFYFDCDKINTEFNSEKEVELTSKVKIRDFGKVSVPQEFKEYKLEDYLNELNNTGYEITVGSFVYGNQNDIYKLSYSEGFRMVPETYKSYNYISKVTSDTQYLITSNNKYKITDKNIYDVKQVFDEKTSDLIQYDNYSSLQITYHDLIYTVNFSFDYNNKQVYLALEYNSNTPIVIKPLSSNTYTIEFGEIYDDDFIEIVDYLGVMSSNNLIDDKGFINTPNGLIFNDKEFIYSNNSLKEISYSGTTYSTFNISVIDPESFYNDVFNDVYFDVRYYAYNTLYYRYQQLFSSDGYQLDFKGIDGTITLNYVSSVNSENSISVVFSNNEIDMYCYFMTIEGIQCLKLNTITSIDEPTYIKMSFDNDIEKLKLAVKYFDNYTLQNDYDYTYVDKTNSVQYTQRTIWSHTNSKTKLVQSIKNIVNGVTTSQSGSAYYVLGNDGNHLKYIYSNSDYVQTSVSLDEWNTQFNIVEADDIVKKLLNLDYELKSKDDSKVVYTSSYTLMTNLSETVLSIDMNVELTFYSNGSIYLELKNDAKKDGYSIITSYLFTNINKTEVSDYLPN